ncbi:TauD/TfdA family dioxygenase [Microbacterium sp. UBA3486]|nr:MULTISPECIES: TauD/TfdA family dioxygenase [Microbacterium]
MTQLSFAEACNEVVEISDPTNLRDAEKHTLEDLFLEHGIAVFRGPLSDAATVIHGLRDALDLGDPFSPPLYSGTAAVRADGLSQLNVDSASAAGGAHPSFGTTDGQRLHTDGTLQPIGLIRTTILYCEQAAADGGGTYFFNSNGVFSRLRREDPDAAEQLSREGVLRRISNIGDDRHIADGPAFADSDEAGLQTRFALSSTDYWNIPDGEDGRALLRGLSFLLEAQTEGSPDFVELNFEPGMGVLFANDRLSHGRRSFVNHAGAPRSVQRGLYTRVPKRRARA